jgi:K+-sensing histidine kinase KdpD
VNGELPGGAHRDVFAAAMLLLTLAAWLAAQWRIIHLSELSRRIRAAAERERLRADQELAIWQAVGHEIMAPLQSLTALHGAPDDPSARYVHRMRRAVRVLHGCSAPSQAFLAAALQRQTLNVEQFLRTLADNAICVGISGVSFDGLARAVLVKADEHALEDVITHVLTNADRYRRSGTAIRMTLRCQSDVAEIRIHNQGPRIETALLGRIFEYGVSTADSGGADVHRGQGLFVARTYMAKMGGTIEAVNVADGVEFVLKLALA